MSSDMLLKGTVVLLCLSEPLPDRHHTIAYDMKHKKKNEHGREQHGE